MHHLRELYNHYGLNATTDKTDINDAIEPPEEKDENLEKRIRREFETKAFIKTKIKKYKPNIHA